MADYVLDDSGNVVDDGGRLAEDDGVIICEERRAPINLGGDEDGNADGELFGEDQPSQDVGLSDKKRRSKRKTKKK